MDGMNRERDLDARLAESLLDSPIHLASQRPLFSRQSFESRFHHHSSFGELIDADQLQGRQYGSSVRLLIRDALSDLLQRLNRLIGVRRVIQQNLEDEIGVIARQV